MFLLSLPMRERGLKFTSFQHVPVYCNVAPHAGAWIEILNSPPMYYSYNVAPHAGAWIEMRHSAVREFLLVVAPHAGAWIEILR